MERLTVADRTEVLLVDGLPPELLPPRPGRRRVAILTQPTVTDLAIEIARRLEEDGLETETIGLPDRDEAKSLKVASSVYELLGDAGVMRDDTVLAVGGGAATDLAGFVAATWMRGVEVVHFPTTLLAAVDASIGGKTGVNVKGKNLVGAFWHPTRVVIDLGVLRRLPSYLTREGMAEVFKAGLIGDADLAGQVLEAGPDADLAEIIRRSIEVKARLVEADEREAGVRAVLNFGHTLGHAIELASTLSHGESVGLGMVAAAEVSARLNGFDSVDLVRRGVEGLGLPASVEGVDRTRVEELLRLDKKQDSAGLRMVLLRAVADPVLEHVGEGELDHALAAIGL